MISNLQLLRAFAALAVVFYHTGYFFNGMHTEFGGVAIFFCLSGFMMAYVSRRGTEGFLLNRVVRIVPMYWVATSALVLWVYSGLANPVVTWPQILNRHPVAAAVACICLVVGWPMYLKFHRKTRGDTSSRLLPWLILPALMVCGAFVLLNWRAGSGEQILHLMKSLLFIPYTNADGGSLPVLGVGWTLNIEVVLYVLFSVFLMLTPRWAPVLVAIAVFGFSLLDQFLTLPALFSSYVGSYANCFASGILIYFFWRHYLQNRRIPKSLAMGAVMLFTPFFFAWHLSPAILAPALQMVPSFAKLIGSVIPELVVMLALVAHEAGIRVAARMPLLIGAASYSIYLFHGIVLETIRPVGERWGFLQPSGSLAAASAAVVLSTILGCMIYRWIEVPMLDAYRGFLRRSRSAKSSAHEIIRT